MKFRREEQQPAGCVGSQTVGIQPSQPPVRFTSKSPVSIVSCLTLLKARHHHRALKGGPRCSSALHHGTCRRSLAIQHSAAAAASCCCRRSAVGAGRERYPLRCTTASAGGRPCRAETLLLPLVLLLYLHWLLRCRLRWPAVLHRD